MKTWLKTVVVLAVIFQAVTKAAINTACVDVVPHEFYTQATSPDKLSPELRLAEKSSATFLGLSPKGQVILKYNNRLSTSRQRGTLLESLGVSEVEEQIPENYEKIDKIVVLCTDLKSVHGGSFRNWDREQNYAPGNYFVLHSTNGFDGKDLGTLITNRAIKYVQPDYSYQFAQSDVEPNDPYYRDGSEWALTQMSVPTAWRGGTGSNIIVAVIDTGIDYNHEDLISNLWHSPDASPDIGRRACGFDFAAGIEDPMDTIGHGTHCAGIIGAIANNSLGIVGVCWNVQLMGLKVSGPNGSALDTSIVPAIDFAITNHANIINLSFGSPFFSPLVDAALQRASNAGLLIVAAACNSGNDNDSKPFYPASCSNPHIISVLAVDPNGFMCPFSNYGQNSVQIGAPGMNIFSTFPGNRYTNQNGTSESAAYVSGAAALIWSQPPWRSKNAIEVRQAILSNCKPIPGLADKCSSSGILSVAFLGGPAPSQVFGSAKNVGITPMNSPTTNEFHTTGILEFPVFAIGGETTGIGLRPTTADSVTNSKEYEIDIGNSQRFKDLANQLAGKKVEVSGTLSIVKGVEIPERNVIKVDNIQLAPQ